MQETQKVVDNESQFIVTNTGVMIVGSEHVGTKLAGLLCEAIKIFDTSKVASIILRTDGYPIDPSDGTSLYGVAFADTHSIAINLEQIFNGAMETAIEGEKHLSFMGLLMVGFLSAIGHELDHLTIAADDRELYETMRADAEGQKELEDSAREAEKQLIIQLARDFDTEIPAPTDMGYFGVRLMELFTGDRKDEEWVVKARKQLEEGIIYEEEGVDKLTSFRRFVELAYKVDPKGFEQPVNPVDINAHLENGEILEIPAEELPQPEVKIAEAPKANVAEAAASTSQPLFVGVNTEDAEYDGDDGEGAEELSAIDYMDDTEVPAAASAPAPQAAPAAPAADEPEILGEGLVDSSYYEASSPADNLAPQVEVPAPVAQQQAAFANAAGTATPPAPSNATTYEPNNLDASVIQAAMTAIYKTLYHHIFTKCGWMQNPETGKFYFSTPMAVLEGVNVSHIIEQLGAHNLIMEYDTADANGKYCSEQFNGMIRGHITSQAGIPRYTLYLNLGGRRIQRSFVPQNPNKMNAQNAYSNPALEAQQGNMIAYVMKGEAPQGAKFNEKCAVTIKNNDYQVVS